MVTCILTTLPLFSIGSLSLYFLEVPSFLTTPEVTRSISLLMFAENLRGKGGSNQEEHRTQQEKSVLDSGLSLLTALMH